MTPKNGLRSSVTPNGSRAVRFAVSIGMWVRTRRVEDEVARAGSIERLDRVERPVRAKLDSSIRTARYHPARRRR